MNTHSSIKFKISIAVALVLSALGGYFAAVQFSQPAERDLMREFIDAAPVSPASEQAQSTTNVASVGEMLEGLRQRLEQQPDDVQGWILLSKSYYHLNRQAEAEESFDRAVALGYSGKWQPLPRIDAFAKSVGSAQGFSSSIGFDKYRIGQADVSSTPGLKLRVSLDPALTALLAPESPVYVFVRAHDNPGPPLAVVRKRVAELPLEIALNDEHAMMPNLKMSTAKTVIAGARVSLSGNPERRPGDYEQLSDSIPSDFAETVELVIRDRI